MSPSTFTEEELDRMPAQVRAQYEAVNPQQQADASQQAAVVTEPLSTSPEQTEDQKPEKAADSAPAAETREEPEPKTEKAQGAGAEEKTRQAEEESWEHKYRVLQGKLDNARQSMIERQEKWEGKIEQLSQQIAELARQRGQTEPPVVQTPSSPPQGQVQLTAEEEEWFKTDPTLRTAVEKIAESKASPYQEKIAKLESELTDLRDTTTRSRSTQFWSDVLQAIPDYTALIQDRTFMGLLYEYNPVFEKTLFDAAQSALDNFNLKQLVAVFKEARKKAPVQKPAASLESEVMPTRPGPGAPPVVKRPERYTLEQFKRLHNELLQGDLGSPESVKLRNELDAAVREGRVELPSTG